MVLFSAASEALLRWILPWFFFDLSFLMLFGRWSTQHRDEYHRRVGFGFRKTKFYKTHQGVAIATCYSISEWHMLVSLSLLQYKYVKLLIKNFPHRIGKFFYAKYLKHLYYILLETCLCISEWHMLISLYLAQNICLNTL